MHTSNIYILLKKYLNKTIRKEELDSLKEFVNSSQETEMKKYLEELWMNHDGIDKNSIRETANLKLFISGITNNRKQSIRRIGVYTRRIAAILIFGLFAGVGGYLYKQSNISAIQELMVMTESGQRSFVLLPDSSKITLNSGSKLTYNSNFGKKERLVELEGEAYMQIARNEEVPFIITTSQLRVEVLGTTFNIYSYADEDIFETSLVEGSVKVSSKILLDESIILKPNQKVTYNKRNNTFELRNTDNFYETNWINGILSLRSEKFDDVINKIERFYGVKIHLTGNVIKDDRFTGTFNKNQNITDVLNILAIQYSFKLKMQNDEFYLIAN